MKYGYFDDPLREYVITRPDTPLPWINYLGCQAYFGIISNTAGGYSFYRDARLRRISDAHPFRFPHAWLLYHPQLRNVQRIRAFADHLVQSFRRLAPVFEGGVKSTERHDPAASNVVALKV